MWDFGTGGKIYCKFEYKITQMFLLLSCKRISSLILLLLLVGKSTFSQNAEYFANGAFLKKLSSDSSYKQLKEKVVAEYEHSQPGHWGEFVKGVDEDIITQQKYIAFTFDACGGPHGDGYDKELIDLLKKEKIPATIFFTGRWIDANFATFLNLSKDTLFEIENHGLNHKPCSIDGESEYGIHGTADVADAFDEIEANARKIEALTNHKPRFYRSATAFIDEACARMAGQLGITAISFQVLSGDAVPFTPATVIEENVISNIKPGAIVIMHMNHPEWYTYEALLKFIPELRQMGYKFVRLNGFPLRPK
jgi:peptidoglycan/xylan/chitin deacetylase (PgdA/CDA1 family)